MSFKVTRLGPPRIRQDTIIVGDVVFEAADLIPGVTVEDEGTPLATAATTLDFVGAGVTASGTGAAKTITIPGGSGLTVEDEGTPLATDATTLDFVGAGVTASGTGATKTITIPGGSGITVEDEGTPLTTAADTLDFVGSGVVASGTGTTKTITISGGGGGLSHSYVGTTSIGGTTEQATNMRQYMKKITLANDCLVTSVGAYVRQFAAGNVMGFAVGILDDDSNSPDHVIAMHVGQNPNTFLSDSNGAQGDARWLHLAIGMWLTAGDYWLAVEIGVSGADRYLLYYDAGSDQIFDNAAFRITDAGWTTVSDSTRNYSIRADILE